MRAVPSERHVPAVAMQWGGMNKVRVRAENCLMEGRGHLFWEAERGRNGQKLLGIRLQLNKRNIYIYVCIFRFNI